MSKNGKLIFKNFDPYITSPFGYRIHPINKVMQFHQGVDYGTNNQKLPQYAIEDGVVTGCGTDSTGAKYVYVKYPRLGKTGIHYHLDSYTVKNNQKVDANTIVGYTGATGRVTGIHLHFGWFPTEDRNKAWDKKRWEDFEAYEFPKEEESKPNTLKYKIGDTVKINAVYVSSTSNKKVNPAITTGKITRIVAGARNPYLLENGNIGWVNDNCITEIVSNSNYIVVNTTQGVWSRLNGYGFNYPKYKVIPYQTKCDLIARNVGYANGYNWDKIKYDGKELFVPNKWNKYL